jgi:iron complex outermembrane recepter protein
MRQVANRFSFLVVPRNTTWKLETSLKPFAKTDLRFSAVWSRNNTRGAINGLPQISAKVQSLFPERFIRNASGVLQAVDIRPINLASRQSETLRTGVNFSKQIRSSKARQDAMRELFRSFGRTGSGGTGGNEPLNQNGSSAVASTTADGTGAIQSSGFARTGGGTGGGFGGGGPGGGGRLSFSAYYTLHLSEKALVRAGSSLLDLRQGESLSSSGGLPRHEVETQFGISKDGFGTRISANWQSGSHVNALSGNVSDNLRFAAIGTVDLRLFVNLGVQPGLVKRNPWLRGTRISFLINNLFGARQDVTDGSGVTPRTFLPAYRDPIGTTFRLSIRKVFF